MSSPQIVTLNVSVSTPPAPLTLQSTGAIISQGATTQAANAYALITQPSDLTALLAAPLAIASLAWSGGSVLATTSANIPGRSTGDKFVTTIAGATPAGYNGLVLATVTGANTFTYPLASNPGSETAAGTYTPPGQGELVAQINTFFGQGVSQSVYVLELGAGDQTTGPALLQTWIQTNPGIFYSYLVPRGWDASAELLALLALFNAPTTITYFFVTTKTSTYTNYLVPTKCLFAMVEAPGTPLTEFSLAAEFQRELARRPSTTNRSTPSSFGFLFGVTPYPTVGNNALLTQLKAANVNYVATASEGGLSTAMVVPGKVFDSNGTGSGSGNDFSFWYSADWFQLNTKQVIANEIINGSNNSLNPLYYDQPGVDRLQDRVVQVQQSAITFGLANGTSARAALDGPAFLQALDNGAFEDQDVVNAVPLRTYVAENPGDFAVGAYNGLSAVYIPQRGFQTIIFNINVTSFLGF